MLKFVFLTDLCRLKRSCFFPLIQTRFRKSLEPSINVIPDGPRRKALKAAGSLVIAFSGGTSSTAMLDLVAKTYFAQRTSDAEERRGGKEHPRNLDQGVWKGTAAVCFVEVCGAFDDVRLLSLWHVRHVLIVPF